MLQEIKYVPQKHVVQLLPRNFSRKVNAVVEHAKLYAFFGNKINRHRPVSVTGLVAANSAYK
jgi:hypothetical protein